MYINPFTCTGTNTELKNNVVNQSKTNAHPPLAGLVGFARLIPGDVFEVSLKHGHQKWRTKGRQGTAAQTWEQPNHVFKALVGDVTNIKVRGGRHQHQGEGVLGCH